ncbi:MAG: serine protease [Ilumatobacteraceae bacterium]|nr:serine protease [Ilumatobacteraceae bacterium]MDP4705879.1 serine protease [Ilumatobacteraceae bacterium]MDP4713090.1 serine protease [Ilumatobacteraceae bacterium]MDP4936180.1 serine protease [Ilumatobacteraceae bacterium]MDP4976632.1 serine protease [Ilumatobacteraceae bacterium]
MAVNDDFGPNAGDSYPDAEYTPAPQPPHERLWRHPSEVGFAAVAHEALTPLDIGRRGRGLVGFSCIAGAVLISGLLLILIPRADRQNTSDVVALTNRNLQVAAVDSNLETSKAMGIILFNNQILVTTTAALGELETVAVRLPNRSISTAHLVHVFPNNGIAVLRIEQPIDPLAFLRTLTRTSGIKYSKGFTSGQVVTVLLENPKRFVINEVSQQAMITLRMSDNSDFDIYSFAEGAPVVDQSGRLVGLCTHSESELGFIPITSIEQQINTLIADGDIFSLQPTP